MFCSGVRGGRFWVLVALGASRPAVERIPTPPGPTVSLHYEGWGPSRQFDYHFSNRDRDANHRGSHGRHGRRVREISRTSWVWAPGIMHEQCSKFKIVAGPGRKSPDLKSERVRPTIKDIRPSGVLNMASRPAPGAPGSRNVPANGTLAVN
jgi:hypothetical protein